MERFTHKQLNERGDKDQCRVEISNRFTTLDDLDTEVGINSAWESTRRNITISVKESLDYGYKLTTYEPWLG
jgi:hypothetical protein